VFGKPLEPAVLGTVDVHLGMDNKPNDTTVSERILRLPPRGGTPKSLEELGLFEKEPAAATLDFDLKQSGDQYVLTPVSSAARFWTVSNLPGAAARLTKQNVTMEEYVVDKGKVLIVMAIETAHLDNILARLKQDNLTVSGAAALTPEPETHREGWVPEFEEADKTHLHGMSVKG
jgi:hypothetical protein